MLVPSNSDVTFENVTFEGVVSFDIQKYTSPWSNLNSLTFKNCIFKGIIVGTCPASNVTFDGCKFENYTKNNNFDITLQGTENGHAKNMAINIGQSDAQSKFTLIDDGNHISKNTAALYTAAIGSGSNQYIAVSGNKVLDSNGNDKVINVMVWKTTASETFEMKTI